MAIKVTPELLRNTSQVLVTHMQTATAIAQQYLADQENVHSPTTWFGPGVVQSNMTASEVSADLQKVLMGGTRLAEGLNGAAALMESHEADSVHAFAALFAPPSS